LVFRTTTFAVLLTIYYAAITASGIFSEVYYIHTGSQDNWLR